LVADAPRSAGRRASHEPRKQKNLTSSGSKTARVARGISKTRRPSSQHKLVTEQNADTLRRGPLLDQQQPTNEPNKQKNLPSFGSKTARGTNTRRRSTNWWPRAEQNTDAPYTLLCSVSGSPRTNRRSGRSHERERRREGEESRSPFLLRCSSSSASAWRRGNERGESRKFVATVQTCMRCGWQPGDGDGGCVCVRFFLGLPPTWLPSDRDPRLTWRIGRPLMSPPRDTCRGDRPRPLDRDGRPRCARVTCLPHAAVRPLASRHPGRGGRRIRLAPPLHASPRPPSPRPQPPLLRLSPTGRTADSPRLPSPSPSTPIEDFPGPLRCACWPPSLNSRGLCESTPVHNVAWCAAASGLLPHGAPSRLPEPRICPNYRRRRDFFISDIFCRGFSTSGAEEGTLQVLGRVLSSTDRRVYSIFLHHYS
jgi:hypothetical protein